ncbi:MAG: permease prefix domain 1-containing protein [Candidatus Limnocylindrales bacterium]
MADERSAYLDRLSDRLRLSEPYASEVRAEVASHLDDAIDQGRAAGLDEVAATRQAVTRLGSPDELADGLRAAHQTRRRLVAGIAGGATAAVGGGIFGTIFGWMLLLALGLGGAALAAAVGRVTGVRLDAPGLPSTSWEALLAALAMAVGAFLAGRAAVRATTARSRRRTRSITVGWSVAGVVALAAWLLFVFRTTLDGLVVAAELLVPLAFVLGATVGAGRSGPRHGRVLLLAVAVASLAGLAGLVALAGVASRQLEAVGSGPYASMDDLWHAQGFDPLGRPTPESMQGVLGDQGLGQSSGVATMWAEVKDAGALRGWTALALEAWRAEPQTMAIVQGEAGPFASAPAQVEGGQIRASVRIDDVRGVDTYAAVLVGVGPDGVRYVLAGPNGLQTHFVGTIWDWLMAAGA